MKKFILGLLLIQLFGCTKDVKIPVTPNTTISTPIVSNPTISTTDISKYEKLPYAYYIGKTSYQLKKPFQFINVDSLRIVLGVRYKGMWNGNGNYGYVYVDINNDGLEDIFYPYTSNGNYETKPDVFLNKGDHYVLDNTMLPNNFSGTILTRKTLVSDFNNDSLPDLFLVNSGWDNHPFTGERNTLLLSNKITGKYTNGDVSMIPLTYWHGGASGDLNKDGNNDLIIVGGQNTKILFGDGKGSFSIQTYKYVPGWGNYTTEIIDVDKDGLNDIIITGNETAESKSLILWNRNGNFNEQSLICDPSKNGWGTVMDIACDDVDGDGVNEIFLDRTGDETTIWYGGYNIVVYKTKDNYKTFKEIDIIKNNSVTTPVTGNWMTRMVLYKNNNNQFIIQSDISDCYYFKDYRKNPFTKTWKQNPTTKIFE
jgi:hypothetical protein